MKKVLRILADLNMTVVGLLFAWICFEGSARTIGMYLILWMSFVYFLREYTRKEE
jgi:TRAP-type C4-dicarboxylate transport system permease small subunit